MIATDTPAVYRLQNVRDMAILSGQDCLRSVGGSTSFFGLREYGYEALAYCPVGLCCSSTLFSDENASPKCPRRLMEAVCGLDATTSDGSRTPCTPCAAG